MAIKIEFDAAGNPEQPTILLAKKSGEKLGMINAKEIEIADNLNDAAELSFSVYKECDGKIDELWDKITDFKLAYCVEWNTWFEITVELDESDESIKTVSCTQLGQAELGQVMLYTIEINTEEDIARDDYKDPTVFYNPENPKASLLHRIMEKASHYKITHVDSSLVKIQRTFSFDETSLYDAFQEIAEEVNCLFVFPSQSDGNGVLQRTIEVYDLESNCVDCGYRGEFTKKCPECDSENIVEGYGDDTGIFVSADELAESIGLSTDADAVKNCFKLEAGDDLMNAAIRSCNPNGTDYIWYITDDMKADMSDALVSRLDEYDEQYDYYQNEHIVLSAENEMLTKYNALVDKYKVYNEDLQKVDVPIKGYQSLMNAYYNTIDLELYLESGLMPSVEMSDTTAEKEAAKLTATNLSPCAAQNVKNMSVTTANNVVLSMAKIVADSSRYKIKVANSSLVEQQAEDDDVNVKTWTGSFELTSYADEEDTATSATITVEINDSYELFVKQKLDKALADTDVDDLSISGLFKKDLEEFKAELKKYSRNRLTSFQDACQTCIDILIEQGIADNETWSARDPNLYDDLYMAYLDKMSAITDEMKVRDDEIAVIVGVQDEDGELVASGLQNYLEQEKSKIQSALDFSAYLGDALWTEFCSFRREDKYSNDNYISDTLDNAELFDKAREFLKVAYKEIYKSAELQKSVSTTMRNLLVIEKFKDLVDSFEVGNWIRVFIDDEVYKLRLISYDIDYDDADEISVEFSDVVKSKDSISDLQDVLDQASSMATSYDTVKRQAKKGNEGKGLLDNWAENGLSLTNTKIVGNADNQNVTWDSHGILCREYLPMLDEYDDRQLKIINKGLYVTDDGWKTSRAGIGNFMFYNPETSQTEEGYGVIADTIIGNLILSEKVGVYNESGSIVLNENGVIITANDMGDEDGDGVDDQHDVFVIQSKSTNEAGENDIKQLLYIDDNGNLVLNGTVRINSVYDTNNDMGTLDDIVNPDRYSSQINDAIKNQVDSLNDTIQDKYESVVDDVNYQLNNYKAELGQYLRYGADGLVLGAENSEFSTVIDNRGMYFKEGNTTVSYIRDSQLHIRNAVIEDTLLIGNFFFSEHYDGSVSLTWQDSE